MKLVTPRGSGCVRGFAFAHADWPAAARDLVAGARQH